MLLTVVGFGCTESDLYQWKTTPYQANKLTVSGTVCSDDLHQTDFPIKVLFMVDMSQSLKGDKNDPNGRRGKAIEDVINLWGQNPNFHFGVLVFGSKAKNLLTDATGQKPIGFTRDTTKLLAAANQIKSGTGLTEIAICRMGRCRDIRGALGLANSIVSGDILSADPGEVARTTYVLIMFAGGPPIPAIGRCPCRLSLEEEQEIYGVCGWDECSCKVTCPAGTRCNINECLDESDPDNIVVVPPDLYYPRVIPDTFTIRALPPASPPSDPSACDQVSSAQCVFPPGSTDSCEERILILDVREMKEFAIQNGAGQFQFHTTYLPDNETRTDTDPYYPPGPGACAGDQTANEARTVRLLSQMAYAAHGGFQKFEMAEQIPAGIVKIGQDVYSSQDALVFKELVVFNENVMPDANGIHPDTDADGIIDEIETQLQTCISDPDSDGDGLSDAVEVKLASDPLTADKPVECIDLETTQKTEDDPCSTTDPPQTKTYTRYVIDQDNDGFNQCEERLLGTEDSLYDSDADGIPDLIEFVVGTNYLANDPLQDADMDGIVNREEIRGHTDPRSNDAQSQLDLAYRYEEVDEGLQQVLSFTQPTNITGVTIKNVSSETSPGVGWLKFDPPSGGMGPTLAWRDYADMDTGGNYGPAVEVTDPRPEGYMLTSCRTQAGGGCTPESTKKFITVDVDGVDSYPPKPIIEKINISSARKNCLRFTVRNITLLETGMDRLLKTPGNNTIKIFFAEAPERAKEGYGIFRVASVRLTYLEGPPEERVPKTPEITFTDDEFELDVKIRP